MGLPASEIVSTVGGAASGIAGMTGIGSWLAPVIGLATSGISAGLKYGESKKQAERAEQLRNQSNSLQKGALRPEYLKALRMNEMAAMYGLPGFNQFTENIDEGVANNMRAIRESSPDGAAALSAIGATLAKANDAKNALAIQDATMKAQKIGNLANQVSGLGDKQMDLVGLQRADKAALNTGAMNLENAATANKVGSIDQILSTVGAFGNTIGKLGGGANTTTNGAPVTLADGTQVSAETIAAIMAAMNKGGGNALPFKFQ